MIDDPTQDGTVYTDADVAFPTINCKRELPPQPTEEQMAESGCFKHGGFSEAHVEHMAVNGDCPWCGAYDTSKWRGK